MEACESRKYVKSIERWTQGAEIETSWRSRSTRGRRRRVPAPRAGARGAVSPRDYFGCTASGFPFSAALISAFVGLCGLALRFA